MGLQLYNTLTRRIEPLEPLNPPRVTFYMCGPTVWSYAHIGNFRTFLFGDLLGRYLKDRGYDVLRIMNLTDVDDRTITAATKAGVSIAEHTAPFVEAFFRDRDYLRIQPADLYPRATDAIGPMVELVQRLLDRGVAYRSEDGSVYFAVNKFAGYGRLSRLDKRELKPGARVSSDEYSKEDVRDFALWKAASSEDETVGAAWDAPFGRGRPGWHLECSAMVLEEIGTRFGIETLDIHAGGVDLIFPHPENEMAQSEGATGVPFVRCWVHGEFLIIGGTKMSKRFGNILTARDLKEEGVDPAAVRMLVFSTHYRQQLNFTDEALEGANEAVERLGDFRERLVDAVGRSVGSDRPPNRLTARPPAVEQLEREFRAALDDDLNAPKAIGSLFSFVRAANRELDAHRWEPRHADAALGILDRTMEILDLLPTAAHVDAELKAWVEAMIDRRQAARRAGDYSAADAIRDEVAARGIELEDTAEGTRWRRRAG